MVVWRLTRKKYLNDFSGEGARIHGGRWNHKGTAVVYTSEHCSLALLELLANTSKELIPEDLYSIKFFIPDEIEISTIDKNDLPSNWQTYPTPFKLAAIGTNRFKEKEIPALKVPSVIVPSEFNILLNPQHPLFKKIDVIKKAPFAVDFRLEN